jgi:hypothetical protein
VPKKDSVKIDSLSKYDIRLASSKSIVLIDLPKKTEKKKQDTVSKKQKSKQ